MGKKAALAWALAVLGGLVVLGQASSVGIDQAYEGDRNVTGQGVPGSVPVTVYEVVGTSRNYLGRSSSMDQQGYYAIAVNPLLVKGQKIVVVDSQGRISGVTTVAVKTGPAGPGN